MTSMSKTAQPILPNFLIAGAAKCGTTSLHHYLRQHPDVFMCYPKEPRFFSGFAGKKGVGPGDDIVARSSIATFDEYSRLFIKGAGKKAVGEASVSTLFLFERTIPSIKHYLGDPRIIIILRDPVDSVYSTYNFLIRLGRETLSLEDALRQESARKKLGFGWIWLYRESRLYAHQVRAFQENFSRVSVHLYDDLKANPAQEMRRVSDFLQINPDFTFDTSQIFNASGVPKVAWFNWLFIRPKRLHKLARTIGHAVIGEKNWGGLREKLMGMNLSRAKPMTPEVERELRAYFRDDIQELEKLIGRDLEAWLAGKVSKDANISAW